MENSEVVALIVPRSRGRRETAWYGLFGMHYNIIPREAWEFIYVWKLLVKSMCIHPIYFRVIKG